MRENLAHLKEIVKMLEILERSAVIRRFVMTALAVLFVLLAPYSVAALITAIAQYKVIGG